MDGLQGDPALIGFDSGTGTTFNLPGSGTDAVLMLNETSNIAVPGVFVFRIGPGGITSGMSEFDHIIFCLSLCVLVWQQNVSMNSSLVQWQHCRNFTNIAKTYVLKGLHY